VHGIQKVRRARAMKDPSSSRTATPAINDGKWRHSAALGEFEPLILSGVQRSLNRKVQGSNPWSGAIPNTNWS